MEEKEYIICDRRTDNITITKGIFAKSPLEAVKKLYPYAQRVTQGGDIVVYGCTGNLKAYCYKENELMKLWEKQRQARELYGYVPFLYLLEEEKLYKENRKVYNE